jgi:hypothetical protein
MCECWFGTMSDAGDVFIDHSDRVPRLGVASIRTAGMPAVICSLPTDSVAVEGRPG